MRSIPSTRAQSQLDRLLEETRTSQEPILITESGAPAAILLSVDLYDGLVETCEILSDSELCRSIARGLADLEAGRVVDEI